jgi:hypothetical protein
MSYPNQTGANLAPLLYALRADLGNFTTDHVSANRTLCRTICESGPLADNGPLSDELHMTFTAANQVVRRFNKSPLIPRHRLTRAAVKAANKLNTPVCTPDDDHLCFEAELRVRTHHSDT